MKPSPGSRPLVHHCLPRLRRYYCSHQQASLDQESGSLNFLSLGLTVITKVVGCALCLSVAITLVIRPGWHQQEKHMVKVEKQEMRRQYYMYAIYVQNISCGIIQASTCMCEYFLNQSYLYIPDWHGPSAFEQPATYRLCHHVLSL